jgi:sarcosine oxidase subunit gamma
MPEPVRTGSLDGKLLSTAEITITPLAPATRLIFRGKPAAIAAAGTAFGAPLSLTACRAVTFEDRSALWLGPDEYLLITPDGIAESLEQRFADALGTLPYALVDVSQRQTGLTITGAKAAIALNAGCPLDLDLAEFPVGMCTRTVFCKAEIVLWRRSPERFHIEVWRSFSNYVWELLALAAQEGDI